jgi:cysteine desulfurase/selenocysteine lyase
MDPTAARCFFPLTKQFIFMNHAGVAPLCERAKAILENLMEQLVTRPFPEGLEEEESGRLRSSIGGLLGAAPDTIGLVRSVNHGISLVTHGVDWRPGDNVVGVRGEHTAGADPWASLSHRGVEYRAAGQMAARVTPDLVLSLVDERTRMVALSHVGSWDGYRVDLQEIGFELRRRGIITAIDVAQSAGALRLDLRSLPVDFAFAPASKWLLGPRGIGFCYSRTGYEHEPARTARRFEESAMSVLELAAVRAGIDLLQEVGAAQVERQVVELARRLAVGLAERGYEIVEPWPRGSGEDSGIVSFRRPGSTAQEVLRDLNAARVVGRTHADFVRLSPHFYNTVEEVDHVLDVLAPGGVTAG